ncbi:nicotinamide n-methyltransferase [Tulasnella sp. JGI-2019a]|nr:nicotinamide n-methyltransferase [Tulasnella sp. JGI-2019a]KAG9013808.1 nicotinamide n-methyltransferase [Tulasnella sp. JGI-2019a]KAG9038838.1 nicotinamide n-methyltransferase [Tulasnella sp. JGI-2019a]
MSNEEEGNDGLTLGGMFPEPARPPTPDPTLSSYTRSNKTFVEGKEEILIRLVGSHSLWGHHLWNAARSFASYLESHSTELCEGKRILELGAGGGLPSLIAVLEGADQVLVTDYPDADLLHNLKINVERNIPTALQHKVTVQGYKWGADVQSLLRSLSLDLIERFDMILMSDLIFNHSQHAALLKTCDQVLSNAPTSETGTIPCLLVFYTHHRPRLAERDLDFFRLAKEQGWGCAEIVTERMQPMFLDDPGDEEVRATVHGWRVWRIIR